MAKMIQNCIKNDTRLYQKWHKMQVIENKGNRGKWGIAEWITMKNEFEIMQKMRENRKMNRNIL